MRLEARKYLFDIQESAALVAQFTAGKDLADYQNDAMLRLAVERAFTIIGEALTLLSRVDAVLAARITDFRNIVGFRNILAHAYAQIDDRIVWGIVESKLPVLISEVAELMNEPDQP
ncbi:MAG: HepT-like ribonuclease domain-containing protein [Terracidiphilus sp.]